MKVLEEFEELDLVLYLTEPRSAREINKWLKDHDKKVKFDKLIDNLSLQFTVYEPVARHYAVLHTRKIPSSTNTPKASEDHSVVKGVLHL